MTISKSSRKNAATVKKILGIQSKKKLEKFNGLELLEILRDRAGKGLNDEVVNRVYQLSHGIIWAVGTARVDGVIHLAIERYMTGYDAVNLVADMLSEDVPDIGACPYWLNREGYEKVAKFHPSWKK